MSQTRKPKRDYGAEALERFNRQAAGSQPDAEKVAETTRKPVKRPAGKRDYAGEALERFNEQRNRR